MTPIAQTPIIEAFQDPHATCGWSTERWDSFLRSARSLNLLAKFGYRAEASDLTGRFPEKVRDQLTAARHVADHHQRVIRWEAQCLRNVFTYHQIEFVFLKGAAYVISGLPAGWGRKVCDIDILVRRGDLTRAEKALLQAGWGHTKLEPYDQLYYRRYMHELPPLKHKDRKTLLDVHHNILPESGRLHPDPKFLWDRAEENGEGRWVVLCPEDMVLHSAAHLFQDGDLEGGLRDLFDLDDLMRHFGRQDPLFWTRIVPRAAHLDLERPLFYALNFCKEILKTPIPQKTMQRVQARGPNRMTRGIMEYLGARTLVPMNNEGGMKRYQWQKSVLYIRSHWLRMPPWQLARHLSHQTVRAFFPKFSQ